MKCEFCSTENKRNAKFCKFCGKNISPKTSGKGVLFLIIGAFIGLIYLFGGNYLSFSLLLPLIFLWHSKFYEFTNLKPSSRVWISILLIFCTFFFIESDSPSVSVEKQEYVPANSNTETTSLNYSEQSVEVSENSSLNYSDSDELLVQEDNSSENHSETDEGNKSCVAKFLEETKCQGNDAVMKEFQKTNCEVSWAFYKPCSNGCSEGECVEI